MSEMTAGRITYLLRQRLEHGDGDDLFLEDGDDRIIWVSREDEIEIVVITLKPGKIEVNA